jgi:undecaprenyl diphosphate synthase
MQQVEIEIIGRVQGVLFHSTITRVAQALGLTGFIEDAGRDKVKIAAQGSRENLYELVKWCQKGTVLSKVEGMSYKFVKAKQKFEGEFTAIARNGALYEKLRSIKNLGRRVKRRVTRTIAGEQVEDLNIPKHVLIIPDGNRRWAREQGYHAWAGHVQSVSNQSNIVALLDETMKMGIKYVTFWAMSTENWKRGETETKVLFNIFRKFFSNFEGYAHKHKIKFRQLGRRDRIPADILEIIERIEEETKNYTHFYAQMALDYGGRDEIARAVNKIKTSKDLQDITTEDIRAHLDSPVDVPDPDLIIRTSGEKRLSGGLLFQSDYAEFYSTDVYFPDFTPEHLRLAILDYSYRTRRFGGTAAKDLEKIDPKKLKTPLEKELAELALA